MPLTGSEANYWAFVGLSITRLTADWKRTTWATPNVVNNRPNKVLSCSARRKMWRPKIIGKLGNVILRGKYPGDGKNPNGDFVKRRIRDFAIEPHDVNTHFNVDGQVKFGVERLECNCIQGAMTTFADPMA